MKEKDIKVQRHKAMKATFESVYGKADKMKVISKEEAQQFLEKFFGDPERVRIFCAAIPTDAVDCNGNLITKEAWDKAIAAYDNRQFLLGEQIHKLAQTPEGKKQIEALAKAAPMEPGEPGSSIFGTGNIAVGKIENFNPCGERVLPIRTINANASVPMEIAVGGAVKGTFSMGCHVADPEKLYEYCQQDVEMTRKIRDFWEEQEKRNRLQQQEAALVIEGPVFDFMAIAKERGFSQILDVCTHSQKEIVADEPVAALWIWEPPMWMEHPQLIGRLLESLDQIGEDNYYWIHVKGCMGDEVETRGNLKENRFNLRVGHTVVADAY